MLSGAPRSFFRVFWLQEAVAQITGPVGATVSAISELPFGNIFLFTLTVGVPGYNYYEARFGGYAGRMGAERTLDMMMKGRAVLIDTRDDVARSR